MSTSINDLPVDLLIGIMRHLDQKSLKEATLTCEKWKSVLESHIPWSIKLRTTFTSQHIEAFTETKRKIRNIELYKDFPNNHHQLNHRRNEYILKYYSLFLEILKCFPNLEDIYLKRLNMAQMPENCDLPDLKKLKTLKMWRCHENILQCFRTLGLKSLSVEGTVGHVTSTECHVVNFLRRQLNLTKLRLESFEDLFFQQLCHKTPNGYIQFKLTKLAIHNSSFEYNLGLINFIKIHSETLQTLELEGNFPQEIYELIFSELKKLKFLILGIYEETTFRGNCNQNMSIENLVLDFSYDATTQDLNLVCGSVPNVKILILLESLYAAELKIISSKLHQVTTLFVHILDENFNEIEFSNLTSLYIEVVVNDKVDWDAFTIANSKITEITIMDMDSGGLKLEDIKAITRNLKLQTFKIGSKLSADDSFLSVISDNFPEFKVIDIPRYCDSECVSESYCYAARMMNITFW